MAFSLIVSKKPGYSIAGRWPGTVFLPVTVLLYLSAGADECKRCREWWLLFYNLSPKARRIARAIDQPGGA